MADVHTPEQRRHNMSRIRSADTQPELLLRRGLHARGLRFRLHRRDLPGRPDITFASTRAVILVHGCFWHGHNCPLFKIPATRTAFWLGKIGANVRRGEAVKQELLAQGWRTMVVWECALRGRGRLPLERVLDLVEKFVRSDQAAADVAGDFDSPAGTSP